MHPLIYFLGHEVSKSIFYLATDICLIQKLEIYKSLLTTLEWFKALENFSNDLDTNGDISEDLFVKSESNMINPTSLMLIAGGYNAASHQFEDNNVQKRTNFLIPDMESLNITYTEFDTGVSENLGPLTDKEH